MRRTPLAAVALGLALTITALPSLTRRTEAAASCPAPPPMRFTTPSYVDTQRAGGEPTITTHPDGTYLLGTHAGTTHIFAPEGTDITTLSFPRRYTGQAYYYWSDNAGSTWHFVNRAPPMNSPASGFSDPDFAIDAKGDVYISEINLLNTALSVSTDHGRSYRLQNFAAETVTDRQWTDGDLPGIVYMSGNASFGGTSDRPLGNVGHYIYRSTDGGKTWPIAVTVEGGAGDLIVDKRTGVLYEPFIIDNGIGITVFPDARKGDMRFVQYPIAGGWDLSTHFPALDVDRAGNLYMTWSDNGQGVRERHAGTYVVASTDGGKTWSAPQRLDLDTNSEIWPWLSVGDPGRVAVSWMEADALLDNAEDEGEHGWRIMTAQSLNALGCGPGTEPGWRVNVVTPQPFHTSTVCQGGTICQAQLIDRRLGDYFTIDIDTEGRWWGVWSDTRQGGATSLASFARQDGGEGFHGPPIPAADGQRTTPQPEPVDELPKTHL